MFLINFNYILENVLGENNELSHMHVDLDKFVTSFDYVFGDIMSGDYLVSV